MVNRHDLREEFLATIRSGEHASQFILLEGERGIGKTHFCQVLYRELAALQPVPAFWPPDLLAPGSGRQDQDRNATRPLTMSIPAGAQPAFVWFGISCGRAKDGIAYDALASASKQVTMLQEAIEDALRTDDMSVSRSILLAVFEIATAFASMSAVPGAALLEGGFVARTMARAAQEIAVEHAKRKQRRRQRDEGWALDATRADLARVRSYCYLLSELADELELPTVLFLDDFEFADPTLLRLVASLPDEVPRNLTVLCTAERGVLDAQRLEALGQTAGGWLESEHGQRFSRMELGPPAPSVLAGMVRAAAPRTAEETVDAFVDHSRGNPYQLRLWLDSGRTQPCNGRIELTPAKVRELPDQFETLYAAEWLKLPASSQRVVAIASMLGRAIPRDLLEGVCPRAGVADPRGAVAIARRERWLIAPNADTFAFPDESRRAVAVAEASAANILDEQQGARIGTEALNLVIEMLAGALASWKAATPAAALPVPEGLVPTLEAAVTLAGAHDGGTPQDVTTLTLVFGGFLKEHGAHLQAASHAQRVGRALDARGARQLGVMLELKAAEWLSDVGRYEHASRQLAEIEKRYPAELLAKRQIDRFRTFVAGRELARQGKVDQGNRLLRRLAQDPRDEDRLGHRSSMAYSGFSLGAGDRATAATEFKRRYARMLAEHSSGPWWRQEPRCTELRALISAHDLPSVNAGRAAAFNGLETSIASELRQAAAMWFVRGHWLTARAVNLDLERGLMACHADHPLTLAVRGIGANYLSYLERHEEAIAELDRVLAAYRHADRTDGPGPDMFVTQGMRAYALLRQGRHDDALQELHDAHVRAVSILGPRHLVVTDLRGHMARALAWKGEDNDARTVYAEVVADYEAALGTHDRACIIARKQLAWLRANPHRSAITVLGGVPVRSLGREAADRRTAQHYQQEQAEEWALLFGTATRRLRLKQILIQRVRTLELRAEIRPRSS